MQATTTHLIILRHGETQWNTAGKHQGQLDSPLTALGIAQAKAAAEYLQGEHFDLILSSDLGRAARTAELIANVFRLAVQTETRLRERHLGLAEGLTREELRQRHPEVFNHYFSDPDYSIPGGESVRQCDSRVGAWMTELAVAASGKRILAVTHGLILGYILKRVLGLPLEAKRKFSLFNTGINRFAIRNHEWFLESWGETVHIKNAATLDGLKGDG